MQYKECIYVKIAPCLSLYDYFQSPRIKSCFDYECVYSGADVKYAIITLGAVEGASWSLISITLWQYPVDNIYVKSGDSPDIIYKQHRYEYSS